MPRCLASHSDRTSRVSSGGAFLPFLLGDHAKRMHVAAVIAALDLQRIGRFARDEPVLDQPVEHFREGQSGVSYAGLNCLLHRVKLYRNSQDTPCQMPAPARRDDAH